LYFEHEKGKIRIETENEPRNEARQIIIDKSCALATDGLLSGSKLSSSQYHPGKV